MATNGNASLPWTPHQYPTQQWDVNEKSSALEEDVEEPEHGKPDGKPMPAAIHAHTAQPDDHCGRSLVICLDGTGDQFDLDNSNVVEFVSCLKKDDPSQVTYYQTGIGTYGKSGLQTGFSAGLDMAIGSGLGTHIKDAYRFLMQNYKEGDRICLLGFSRGSYTARCLAGMLHKVGLLPAHNSAQVPFAYGFYKDSTEHGWDMSTQFKKTFCTNVNVHFVGVWDCVASVGFIPRKLPFGSSKHNRIKHFRHAMALDEHRAKFKVCHWKKPSYVEEPSKVCQNGGTVSEKATDSEEVQGTDTKEVWFMGAHADVGGGAVLNAERHKLSRIPLRWMLRQCFECNTGILFTTSRLAELGLDLPTLWPVYRPLRKPVVGPSPGMVGLKENGTLPPLANRSESFNISHAIENGQYKPQGMHKLPRPPPELVPEQVEDFFDAHAPVNDQLVVAKGWWVLEFWPVKVRIQREDNDDWDKHVTLNLGRHRAIRDAEPVMHWTVQHMMNDKGYRVRGRVGRNAFWRTTT